MLKKLVLIIFSFFLLACSNADNQTKYVDRKAPKEKEEIVQREEKYSSNDNILEELEMYIDKKAPMEKEIKKVQKQEKYYSDTSVLEDVASQLVSDIIDLGLRVLIYSIIPN